MTIPSRADWGEVDANDLDAKWAFDTFLGKSLAEAEAMFQSNALYYQEDLQSMPDVPFNFYAPALVNYLLSERSRGDSDGASSFLYLVQSMFKTRPEVVDRQNQVLLVEAARNIAARQAFYDADPQIYGSFANELSAIERVVPQGP